MNAMTLAHHWLKQDIWTARATLETGDYAVLLPSYLKQAHAEMDRRRAYAAKQARAEADPRYAALVQAKRDLELKPFAQSIRLEQQRIDRSIADLAA